MAKKTRLSGRSAPTTAPTSAPGETGPAASQTLTESAAIHPEGHTGRYIAVFNEGADPDTQALVRNEFGAALARSGDFAESLAVATGTDAPDALSLDNLGLVILNADAASAASERIAALSLGSESAEEKPYILVPETIEYASIDTHSYLRGLHAAVSLIARDLNLEGAPAEEQDVFEAAIANTWGLTATRVPASSYTGKGIKVAILDTGLDLGHPDFVGRNVKAASFIPGESPQDGNGHGTHVTGTSCGPRLPKTAGPRYGIAYEADILIGKVLSNAGSGSTGGILAGINWAIQQGAQVINMSLGNNATTPNPAYTQAGQAALNRGALIVAAAGNNNAPTGQPANSPTIYAVAAVDSALRRAAFSDFSKIEQAAPGVSIESALPRPRLRGFLSGTSMASPHVAGIAALYAQGTGARAQALWKLLRSRSRPLPLPPPQVGAGLVQA